MAELTSWDPSEGEIIEEHPWTPFPNPKLFMVTTKDFQVLHLFLCDNSNSDSIDMEACVVKEHRVYLCDRNMEQFLRQKTPDIITTKDFWSCNCEHSCIRHKTVEVCKDCGAVRAETKPKHKFIEDILGWRSAEDNNNAKMRLVAEHIKKG